MNELLQKQLESYHDGSCTNAYEFLGCHPETRDGVDGFVFRVWAPNARNMHVVGDFNFWNPNDLPMYRISKGVWEAWTQHAKVGDAYKYLVEHWDGVCVHKADPVGFQSTKSPDTSSVICDSTPFPWHDKAWFDAQEKRSPLESPVNIYEVHVGSWRRKPDGTCYTYAELAPMLAEYVRDMGYTHVELMPLSEYPYDPSWGYQVTHYYSPTSRYGTPRDLMTLVDTLHSAGIGVIVDWVPAHFPKDLYALYEFDGTPTYELSDPMMNEHPDWTTRIFDFGKPEVKSFLISNAMYYLEKFHFDGIRVDAVSSMLYLDYNRPNYKPNRYGGRENLEAIALLRDLNKAAFGLRKNTIMAAEESTAFPLITKPDYDGGLGFLFKWNMGWMNDTLKYIKEDPINRKYHHNALTFSMTYAFSENFILPLSHDEVVHMKGSLINKNPGDYFWKFAGLRALLAYQICHPGKKLTFMGGEIGQFDEWKFDKELTWSVLDYEKHRQLQHFVRTLNHIYLENPPLWSNDLNWEGFQWIDPDNGNESVLSFRRIDKQKREVLVVCNFTPVTRDPIRLGVPEPGTYEPILCSDDCWFGGTGTGSAVAVSEPVQFREYENSALFRIPPMSVTLFVRKPDESNNTKNSKKEK